MLLPKYREQLDTSIWGMRAICWRYSKEISSKFSFPHSTCHSNYRQPSPSKQPPRSLASFTSSIGAGFSSISFFADSLVFFPCFFPSIKYLWIFEIDVKHRERSQVQDLGSGLCQQLCQHLSHLYLCLSEHPWQLGSCDQRPLDGLKINAAGWNILSIEPVSPKLSGRLVTSQHTVSHFTPGKTKTM